MAFDAAWMAVRMLLLCVSCLGSSRANFEPEIVQRSYEMCVDTPPGTHAFTINATDPEGNPLTYSIHGPESGYFTVEKNSGRMTVHTALDRTKDLLTISATVSDGFNMISVDLIIILKKANDKAPIFGQSSYDTTVPENIAVGSSLLKVHATDEDSASAGIVHYKIDNVSPEEGTSLFTIVDTTGVVRLNGALNYTTMNPFYQLKINASDGGGRCFYNTIIYHSSLVYAIVRLEDVPDLDPKFIGLPFIGDIEEHSPVGQSVMKVTAIDQDKGVNDAIIYTIEDSSVPNLFSISRDTGVIKVISDSDRELIGDVVNLTVKGTESKSNIHGIQAFVTARVHINIIDINDNEPVFYKCEGSARPCLPESHFTADVFENNVLPIPLDMMVKDADKVSRTKLILEGADKDTFEVAPMMTMTESMVQLLVKSAQNLDFEKTQQMILQVIATDEETNKRTTATVTINIKDMNDNNPTFPSDTYKLTVAEHSPDGTVIQTITATDPDTMDEGKLTYELLPDSILPYFNVRRDTGAVYVINGTILDREVRSLYSATLYAFDTDRKSGTTRLEFTVTDINDQTPVMNRDSQKVFVEEGGQLELPIQATDADDPDTANSEIVYGIVPSEYSNNFTINSDTGMLTNKGELDREAMDPSLDGKITLHVTATDKGDPPRSTTATVHIQILDANDNAPKFSAPSYKFSVKEAEMGAYVGSVYAEDLDQTMNFNRVSFRITSGSIGSFTVRSFADEGRYRGDIMVDREIALDFEKGVVQYILQVEAADLDMKKAEVKVEVNVLDVNDERPEFRPTPGVKVKENTTITEPVGSFTAYDKDGNHSLVYELVSMNCTCNGTEASCNSFILDPDGSVKVNPRTTLDYEKCTQVDIEARVIDERTEKGENCSLKTGKMVIDIVDINDNAPEFINSNEVYVVVSEAASKDTSVAMVTATDRDSGDYKILKFKVTGVKFKHSDGPIDDMRTFFEAITVQQKDFYEGIIQTTEGLDIKLRGKYLVTVSATDFGGLSTSTVLEIFTVDETFKVELEWILTVAEIEDKKDEIRRVLSDATKARVEILSMRPATPEKSRASVNTIIVTYFLYLNGTAITSVEVERLLSDPEYYRILTDLGLRNIGNVVVNGPETDPLMYGLMGMVAGLIIVLAILTTSLMCTRRNYKRRLKASKALNSAAMMTSENQKSGAVVPGTNKYTMEGANPVLNLNMDSVLVLDLNEESSDVDKISLNSLDCSESMSIPEKTILEEDGELPDYIEPLDAALAQRGQKSVTNNPLMGYNNPAFSTTNL